MTKARVINLSNTPYNTGITGQIYDYVNGKILYGGNLVGLITFYLNHPETLIVNIEQVFSMLNTERIKRVEIDKGETFLELIYGVYGVDYETMVEMTTCRKREYLFTRYLYMYVMHYYFGNNVTQTARMAGRKSHASTLQALREVVLLWGEDFEGFREKTRDLWEYWLSIKPLPEKLAEIYFTKK